MPTPLTHVVLVGHCGFDSGPLGHLARQIAPDAQVVGIQTHDRLTDVAHPRALWLVNRALDGRFNAKDGIELIAQHAGDDAPCMLLVSNFPESQAAAEQAGAIKGFGKNDLGDPGLAARVAAAVKREA